MFTNAVSPMSIQRSFLITGACVYHCILEKKKENENKDKRRLSCGVALSAHSNITFLVNTIIGG